VKANQATYPARVMCRLLGVSASGFYAWDERPLSKRALEDVVLTAKIHAIHRLSRDCYGVPRIHAELAQEHGIHVGRKRVARLMRAARLRGVSRRRFVRTTVADRHAHLPPDLVDRHFRVEELDRLWVADITFIATWAGFLYLAIVLDACSRKVVGWAMENHLRTELVLAAINMALAQRRPEGVIHHSDRGCQGDFQRSSQHLVRGGVAWDDHVVGLQSGRDVHRCGLRAGRVSISGKPSRRSGHALPLELQARMQRWQAASRNRLAPAGFGRPVG
jgi:hypothetical protein